MFKTCAKRLSPNGAQECSKNIKRDVNNNYNFRTFN